MEKIPLPIALNLETTNKSKSWTIFKQKWKNYELATDLDEKTNEKRVATLLSVIGDAGLDVYNAFEWSAPEDSTKIANVLQKFEEYCNPKKNIPYERYLFNSRMQKTDESIDDYVTQLRLLADNCEFSQLKDSLIRDMIIFGTNDGKLKENMLREPDISLEKAMQMCRLTERAKEHHNTMTKQNIEEIDKIVKKRWDTNKTTNHQIKCKNCDLIHASDRNKCPAQGKFCFTCKKPNHFSSVCRHKNVNKVYADKQYRYADDEDDDDDAELIIQ